MLEEHLQVRDLRIDQAAGVAAELVVTEERAEVARFISLVFAQMPASQVAEIGVPGLAHIGLLLWSRFRCRPPGERLVEVLAQLPVEDAQVVLPHSVLLAINDDMPFLLDSSTEALSRRGWSIHFVVHPVLGVRRDTGGRLVEFTDSPDAARPAESLIVMAFDQQIGQDVLDEVRQNLVKIYDDVCAAVTDWQPMLDCARDAIKDLGNCLHVSRKEQILELQSFVEWLVANKFTFTGYREYLLSREGGKLQILINSDAGLGILRDPNAHILHAKHYFREIFIGAQDYLNDPCPLMVTRSTIRSTIHRAVPLDLVLLKRFNASGEVIGVRLFAGLFTSVALSSPAAETPLLRQRVHHVLALSGFDPRGHSGKALVHILDNLPRGELFQMADDDLVALTQWAAHLQERQRTALFVRRDPFGRFVSCLVYLHRDRYDTALREKIQGILSGAFEGVETTFGINIGDDVVARLHFIIEIEPSRSYDYDFPALEQCLIAASRSWLDELRLQLVRCHGEAQGLALLRRYEGTFPKTYRESQGAAMVPEDISHIETVIANKNIKVMLHSNSENRLCFRIYSPDKSMGLEIVQPLLVNFGMPVAHERGPYSLACFDGSQIFLQGFVSTTNVPETGLNPDLVSRFEAAFLAVWQGYAGNDRLNQLVLKAGLDWREVTVLRALLAYLYQIGFPSSRAFVAGTLVAYPDISRALVDLFVARLAPSPSDKERVDAIDAALEAALREVASLEEDRVLRRVRNLVHAVTRTNYWQREDGQPKVYLSFKFDCLRIDALPKPRPLAEIFVYNQEVEAVHLRGSRIARGGIRWSDRREDFRTEILGLMRTQMVKNAVIVPAGSKGGFIMKRSPPPEAGQEAFRDAGIACYRTMMRGLLDLTDNLDAGGTLIAPQNVTRLDGDDPYLVVAADKGTATFSDIANGISRDYGFWLDDAFASGGTAGYDHKKMGITARGAWESVKRHFIEIGTDIQKMPFTVAGVGDMSGDVFGNGMLLSPFIRLIAAFDHRHIFLDPNPDIAISYRERQRLFNLPRSSWNDYDRQAMSVGAMIIDRSAKLVQPTAEVRELLGISGVPLAPSDVIRAILMAPVDLLWFGGIGTYVCANGETDADAGDRTNDAVRIKASDLRCRVVGEGANLAMTQRARIEAGQRLIRLNTDFIDNSAGVDTSDHEVNIKILARDLVAHGQMKHHERDHLLKEMTDEVAALVLKNNYLQASALSLEESFAAQMNDIHTGLIDFLESEAKLDRTLEILPDAAEMYRRRQSGQGLTRPELAVIFAYTKIWLAEVLLASNIDRDQAVAEYLVAYFPVVLGQTYREAVLRHPLRREILATVLAGAVVNRMGVNFVRDMTERTGLGADDVARLYLIVYHALGLEALWIAIDTLDNLVPSRVRFRMLLEIRVQAQTAVVALADNEGKLFGQLADLCRAGVLVLDQSLERSLSEEDRAALAAQVAEFVADGVPAGLAKMITRLPRLVAAMEVSRIASRTGCAVDDIAALFFAIDNRFGIEWLRARARQLPAETCWQHRAINAFVDDLHRVQGRLAESVLIKHKEEAVEDRLDTFQQERRFAATRVTKMLADLKSAPATDLSMLSLAERYLWDLFG